MPAQPSNPRIVQEHKASVCYQIGPETVKLWGMQSGYGSMAA